MQNDLRKDMWQADLWLKSSPSDFGTQKEAFRQIDLS